MAYRRKTARKSYKKASPRKTYKRKTYKRKATKRAAPRQQTIRVVLVQEPGVAAGITPAASPKPVRARFGG